MLCLAKCILVEYKFLTMHTFDEQSSNTTTKGNLYLFCELETFMGLSCIIPLLKCMQFLSKFAQAWDAFIFYFVDAFKACEGNLYRLYVDLIMINGHVDGVFQTFLAFMHHSYDPLHMIWNSKPNFGVEYLGFQCLFGTYIVHKRDVLTCCLSCVFRFDWLNVDLIVKQQCNVGVVGFI